MKILSLGLDNSILNKASALALRAVEYGSLVEKYTVIVPSQDNGKAELSEKVKVYGSSGGGKLAQFIKIYSTAKKLLREEKYDIITVQDQYFLALIGLCLSKKIKLGLEIQVHGFEKYYGVRKSIAKYVLPKANAVRCVSQRLKKQLINKFGVDKEKITVVPIFVDITLPFREQQNNVSNLSLRDRASGRSNLTYSGVSQRLPRRSDYGALRNDIGAFIFLTVGRLVPVKNIGLQIGAMTEVVKEYSGVELWIIGDGQEKERLKLDIKNWKLENSIKLFGWKDNLDEYYNRVDAFMLTSDYEGWGMAVIEAASFGLPIIMTDVGCAGEVIKNDESGMIISVGDKKKLVETMLKIIVDENLRKNLGTNAKLAVSRLPNKEQTLNLYKISWQKAVLK